MAQKVSRNKPETQTATDARSGGLSTILPEQKVVILQGETFPVKKPAWGQMLKLAQLLKGVISIFFRLDPEDRNNPDVILQIITDNVETLTQAAAIITNQPVEWIQATDGDEVIELLVEFYLTNKDFFGSKYLLSFKERVSNRNRKRRPRVKRKSRRQLD